MTARSYGLVIALTSAVVFAGVLLLTRRDAIVPGPIEPIEDESLPVLGDAPGFRLVAESGEIFDAEALTGRIWVADFIFTSCPDVCTVMSRHMARLQDNFSDADDVRFISISVDPETDTPEVLRAYGRRYDADTRRWRFLTGAPADIEAVAVEGFKVGHAGEPIYHSSRFVLVDEVGSIRGYYAGTELDDVTRLARDIETLRAGGS